jgi:hypothetical protein
VEIYDKEELSLLVDSLTNYSVTLKQLRSNIEKSLVGDDLDKFKDDITSIYSLDKEIKLVDSLRDKTLYFFVHKDDEIIDKKDICQENVK